MTYCVAIEAHIVVPTCPLGRGQCYWQHRVSHNCKYTVDDLTEKQFCELVGMDPPVPSEYTRLTENIKNKI